MVSSDKRGGLFLFFRRHAGRMIRMRFRLPGFLSKMMYRERMFRKHAWSYMKSKIYYENMFRWRCSSIGKNLALYGEIPWITGTGNIYIGDDVEIMDRVTLFTGGHVYEEPEIRIGDGCSVGFMVQIRAAQKVEIGKNCMIAGYTIISDNNGHPIDLDRRKRKEKVTPEEIAPVIIEDDVWIGEHALIMKGVTIGRGSVISAGSVVLKSVPPMKIVMGNPARVVMWVPGGEDKQSEDE